MQSKLGQYVLRIISEYVKAGLPCTVNLSYPEHVKYYAVYGTPALLSVLPQIDGDADPEYIILLVSSQLGDEVRFVHFVAWNKGHPIPEPLVEGQSPLIFTFLHHALAVFRKYFSGAKSAGNWYSMTPSRN